ncbi:MAG TPA: chorismate mutase [Acidiphilium sp.]|nr:chorismate mutase [Acidiphilium sp.]
MANLLYQLKPNSAYWNAMSEMPPASPPQDTAPEALSRLRAEIDSLDDRIHDMLMQRAEIIERVRSQGGKRGVMIRPGREAAILRRLLARHKGGLPPHTITRIWRELFSGALMIEGGLVIAVADGGQADLLALAREHFGPLTSMRRHRTPSQALTDITSEIAHAAVLPIPSDEDDDQAAWWVGLMHGGLPRLSIVAKLPFWAKRGEGVPQSEAYVVSSFVPDASGEDRSLIGIEIVPDTSTARILGILRDAGFDVGSLLIRRIARREAAYALADVDGYISREDPRLGAISAFPAPPVVLGAYASPVGASGMMR